MQPHGWAPTTYEEVRRLWPDLIPTEDYRKTQPQDWKWWYLLETGVLSHAGVRRLGAKPETRVKNMQDKAIHALVVGKIGGSVVFERRIAEPEGYPWHGVEGMLPDEVVQRFLEYERERPHGTS